MSAIILASGRGERQKPFTDNTNKVMFKVDGIPLIETHVKRLKEVGVKNIVITLFWQGDKIRNHFKGKNYKGLHFFNENGLTGSGTAVSEIMQKYNFDRTIVIYGDTWYEDFYYTFIPVMYKTNNNFITVEKLNSENKYNSGFISYDINDSKAIEISENKILKSNNPNISIGKNSGILVINKDIRGEGDLMNDVLPKYIDNLHVWECGKLWCDIGELNRYIELLLSRYNSSHVEWLNKYHTYIVINFTKKLLFADRIFICGNGGSATTAEHLALDFSKAGGKNAIALNQSGAMSAYGNDEGFENIFVSQLNKHKITDKDIILLISGSGNSPNIKKVIDTFDKDMIVGMTGICGYLENKIKLTLCVGSENIRVVEDAHLAYGHAVTEIMEGLI